MCTTKPPTLPHCAPPTLPHSTRPLQLLQCFRMHEYPDLRTPVLLRYVQRLQRNQQAISSAVGIVFMLDVCVCLPVCCTCEWFQHYG